MICGLPQDPGCHFFPWTNPPASLELSTHCINQARGNDHMVFALPPLPAAARQQLAELEAAGCCLQKAFYLGRLGGVEPRLFFLHFAP